MIMYVCVSYLTGFEVEGFPLNAGGRYAWGLAGMKDKQANSLVPDPPW